MFIQVSGLFQLLFECLFLLLLTAVATEILSINCLYIISRATFVTFYTILLIFHDFSSQDNHWLSFRNSFTQSNGNAPYVFLKSRHSLHVTITQYIYVCVSPGMARVFLIYPYCKPTLVPRAVCIVRQ